MKKETETPYNSFGVIKVSRHLNDWIDNFSDEMIHLYVYKSCACLSWLSIPDLDPLQTFHCYLCNCHN